jgi:NAD(P)-dependent dehydrogenase (short-subunit alcohol dehydrogenase family)
MYVSQLVTARSWIIVCARPNREGAVRFKDKVVLITGGTKGIGSAIARLFSLEGGHAISVSRQHGRNGEPSRSRQRIAFVHGDVRVAEDCERVIKETLGTCARLDVLINNAGVIYRNRTVELTTEAEWDVTFDTNVKGAFLMSRFALPALRESHGNIVNVASYVGLVGFRGAAAYAASKAALVNLTRTMALDHAQEGVRVNCVCPGSVDTEMIRAAWRAHGDPAEAEQLWREKHPIGRIAKPDEVARAVFFLAGAEASFITGVALPVDGGITAG